MYIIYGLISAVLSCILSCFIGYRICKRAIVIRHDLHPLYWFWVHICVSDYTIILMAISDIAYEKVAHINNLPLGVKGIACAFIQNGGMLVLVMLFSSFIYNYFIKLIEFNYFIERHLWIKKLFFSMAGITLIIMYIIVIGSTQDNINILADEYKPVVVWAIVVIEIWVGFGMQINIPHNNIKNRKRKNKKKDEKQEKTEKKYIMWCLLSMLLCPITMTIGLYINEYISNLVQKDLKAIFWGLVIGSTTMVVMLYGFNFKKYPDKKRSIKNFEKKFGQMNNDSYLGHFMRVEYELKKDEKEFTLKIYQQNIEIEKRDMYPSSFLKKFDEAFKEKKEVYLLQQDEVKTIQMKIEQKLEQISNERAELLKQGWNIAYKLCDDKEKQKSDMVCGL